MSNGEIAAGDGRTLSIRGQQFPRGLGVHSPSALTYALDGTDQAFTATIGIDDETAGPGSAAFQVWTDGTLQYTSPVLTGTSPPLPINIALNGARSLRLVTTDGGNGNSYDHADWAGSTITSTSSTPTATAPPTTAPPTASPPPSAPPTASPAPTAPPTSAPPTTAPPAPAQVKVTKVLTIIEENHSLAQMQAGMPYLYGMAQRYAYADNWTAETHPSFPNYLALAGGSTFAVTDDADPSRLSRSSWNLRWRSPA